MAREKKQVEKKDQLMVGMNITGVIRIFGKEKSINVKGKDIEIDEYWTNVSTKVSDDEWINVSLRCGFKRDVTTPEFNTLIRIQGFLTTTGEGKYARLKLMIMDWEYADE